MGEFEGGLKTNRDSTFVLWTANLKNDRVSGKHCALFFIYTVLVVSSVRECRKDTRIQLEGWHGKISPQPRGGRSGVPVCFFFLPQKWFIEWLLGGVVDRSKHF